MKKFLMLVAIAVMGADGAIAMTGNLVAMLIALVGSLIFIWWATREEKP